ncbi:LOW QUALITY PROTEIN: FERM and PDZ domain-containing protein 2 [Dugong dugon]
MAHTRGRLKKTHKEASARSVLGPSQMEGRGSCRRPSETGMLYSKETHQTGPREHPHGQMEPLRKMRLLSCWRMAGTIRDGLDPWRWHLGRWHEREGISPVVTLASTLQVRGEALSVEELWSFLFLAAEQIREDLHDDSSDYVVCPWSALLSVAESLSFQDNVSHVEAAPFKAPELLQGQSNDEPPDVFQTMENTDDWNLTICFSFGQMNVCSLGMTLYWSAGFRVPPNHPLQLCKPLHSILLTMCEDQPYKWLSLQSVLEACQVHQQEVAIYPAPATLHVQRLVGLVLGTITEVERRVVEENVPIQQGRSYLLRKRLQQASTPQSLHPSRVSERSTEIKSSLEPHSSTSARSRFSLFVNSFLPFSDPGGILPAEVRELQEGHQFSSGSAFSVASENSQPAAPSQRDFLQRKEKFSSPEFVCLAGEAPAALHLPGLIVTKKGKCYLALRDLRVGLLSAQCLKVKCDIELTAGSIFNAIMSFANLGEFTYFGLAYLRGKEFFLLDDETRLCKVAPEGWSKHPQRKTSASVFSLFLRIKFFVSHVGLLQQSQTRCKFYLQLWRDILEEKLYCNDETLLQLGVLALQAEFDCYPQEQVEEGKEYFQVEGYIPASVIRRMTAPWVQLEVSEMHRLSPALQGEEAELEFLRVTQQLPEYGVLVHQVFPEKTRPETEMVLGICAKGVVVYEVKNNVRIATLRFQWRETGKISTYKKFTITSSITGKKDMFVTNSAETRRYLLGLCSAQHGFNVQMSSGSSPRILTDCDMFVQMASLNPAQQALARPLTWIQRLQCSENALFEPRLDEAAGGLLSTSLGGLDVENSKEAGKEGIRGSPSTGPEQLESTCVTLEPRSSDPACALPVHSGSQNNRIKTSAADLDCDVCVTLKRDPCHGFGFVIDGGEDVGKVDPGIFISSILPGGPAEKTIKIKPGGQILALNHISLQGFMFNMAARMIQNADSVELIIAQSKGVCENTPREEKNGTANSGVFIADSLSHGHEGSFPTHSQDQDKKIEKLKMALAQSLVTRLRPQLCPLPLESIDSSCPPSSSETKASEIYFVELVKEDETLGFSMTGGINTSVLHGGMYVKSIVPGGPAAKEGQILRGDRLLQVDGVLCGLTHKQAVQCLKGSGQVTRLVLERRGLSTAQQCPSANASVGDGCAAVSLRTLPGRPMSCVSVTDGHKFKVKLKKNSSGWGFSFVQMERECCRHLKNDLVRNRSLFPGQPAEENGATAAGDIILAGNGKPTEGFIFQEVLHLLRRTPQEVTLLLCHPPPGALPEIDEGQTPALSAVEEFTRSAGSDLGLSPSLDRGSPKDGAFPDRGEGLGLRPESFQKPTREPHWGQDAHLERAWASCLTSPRDPHLLLCRLQQEMDASPSAPSLEKEVRQNCCSACDIRRLESPEVDGDDEEVDGEDEEVDGEDEEGQVYRPLALSSPVVDEEHLPFNSTSASQLPCGACLEADSGTIPCCSSIVGVLSQSLPSEESRETESKWEDLEESADPEDGTLRWVLLSLGSSSGDQCFKST